MIAGTEAGQKEDYRSIRRFTRRRSRREYDDMTNAKPCWSPSCRKGHTRFLADAGDPTSSCLVCSLSGAAHIVREASLRGNDDADARSSDVHETGFAHRISSQY